MKKYLYLILGMLSLGLGAAGSFFPVLPSPCRNFLRFSRKNFPLARSFFG